MTNSEQAKADILAGAILIEERGWYGGQFRDGPSYKSEKLCASTALKVVSELKTDSIVFSGSQFYRWENSYRFLKKRLGLDEKMSLPAWNDHQLNADAVVKAMREAAA